MAPLVAACFMLALASVSAAIVPDPTRNGAMVAESDVTVQASPSPSPEVLTRFPATSSDPGWVFDPNANHHETSGTKGAGGDADDDSVNGGLPSNDISGGPPAKKRLMHLVAEASSGEQASGVQAEQSSGTLDDLGRFPPTSSDPGWVFDPNANHHETTGTGPTDSDEDTVNGGMPSNDISGGPPGSEATSLITTGANCSSEDASTVSAMACGCSKGACSTETKCLPSPMCTNPETALKVVKGDEFVRRSAILLHLEYNSTLVRRAYFNKTDEVTGWPMAYLREYLRIENLVRSAAKVNTTLPIFVVVGGERFPTAEERLKLMGVQLIERPPLQKPKGTSPWHKKLFMKLGALRLTQFRTVILLDNDMTLMRNIDGLAHSPAPAAVWHPDQCAKKAVCTFDSGLMILRPSEDEYRRVKFFLEKDRTVREAVASMDADTTDRVIWSRFYAGGIHELPLSFNAHRGLRLDDDEWRQVHLVHASSRWELDKRSPSWLDELVPSFTAA